MRIKSIKANEILASGGYPTVEAVVTLESGARGSASVPYGASAGTHEASVLVDGNKSRYGGKGVLSICKKIEEAIAPELIGVEVEDQRAIDEKMIAMDGTENKANLGGNGILAVSLAVAKAAANEKAIPLYRHIRETYKVDGEIEKLPNPMIVVIEGGKHAHETTDLQEYCLLGVSDAGPTENIRKGLETYHELKKVLEENSLSTNVGNEGAFAPNGIETNEKPLEYITQAIERTGYKADKEIAIAIDAAASEFYEDGKYNLSIERKEVSSDELIDYYEPWFQKYPIQTIEDMLHEDDWDAWIELTEVAKKYNVENIGDDLTVTNLTRLQKAIDTKAISAILIKLNQIGSLTETVDACLLAKKNGMMTVPSHRGGGETNDTAMVDLAVAVGSSYIKVGPTRGERVSKYNRLMEIERELKV
ncbi:phosphopyruvate hydratase [Candidatus Dojkabacteria bacterium]|nr:phosphopyruvate hydratase [Candidatus Dojkabacteria bacterium]